MAKRDYGRAPDFILKAMTRTGPQRKGKAGAAWLNDDESISIRLDPFASLTPDLLITLFRPDDQHKDPEEGE